MAKILHTSDIHLGLRLAGLGRAGDKVRAALKNAFSKLIDVAAEMRVDAVVISGNLFSSNRVSKPLIDFAMREIARLEEIPVILLPGSADSLEDGALYLTLDQSELPPNLHLFIDQDKPSYTITNKGLTFYGLAQTADHPHVSPLSGLRRESAPGYHIALAHGSYHSGEGVVDHDPIHLEEIESCGFDYLALGHLQSYMQIPAKQVMAVYCGAPETTSFQQKDAGWAVLVTLSEGRVAPEKVAIGCLNWRTLDLDCSGFKYTLELERELSRHAGENTLLKALLTGRFPSDGYIDYDRLQDNLANTFLYLKVLDCTQSAPEELSGLRLPETTILGQFIKLMSDEIAHQTDPQVVEVLRESLRTGYALLSGKDSI